ncbi:hypothetical protein [Psychromonas sp. L1A2]|nr:hypothetical protein [Psychromonas sp. L1A2]
MKKNSHNTNETDTSIKSLLLLSVSFRLMIGSAIVLILWSVLFQLL